MVSYPPLPPGGGKFFLGHLGSFSSCRGGKRRKDEEKGEKGGRKGKEVRKKKNRKKKG